MLGLTRRRLAVPVAAAAAAGTVAALAMTHTAAAHDPQTVTFFVASLQGRNEVPAGDPDGQALEVLRVKGDQVSFAIRWQGIAPPTAGHIHIGASGSNGAVQIPFFGTALPGTVDATVGSVTVADSGLLDSLETNPGGFYANVHTAEFPGGAVRGQLHLVRHAVDLNALLRGGPLAGLLDGDQEVPAAGGPAVGDPDGHATAFARARSGQVRYALHWSGIGAPTNGHIHEGATGVTGPVVVPLFAAGSGLPPSLTGVAGTATGVPADLVRRINANPGGFYANLHTAEFPGGAVRGQLFRTGADSPATPATFAASVVRGKQIYACTGTAFTQHNVSAVLAGDIHHSFVRDDTGPPQWIAPDRSAVTGAVVTRTPNGAGNIAELDLDATSSGAPTGLLAHTVEVLRLNTVGGVPPAGPCDPATQPIAKVPYQADYVFISG
jgi:hypothetical protein